MESFTWGSVEGQVAAVEAAFGHRDTHFDMALNPNDFKMLLSCLVAVANSEETNEAQREWASSFAGSMVEVDWV